MTKTQHSKEENKREWVDPAQSNTMDSDPLNLDVDDWADVKEVELAWPTQDRGPQPDVPSQDEPGPKPASRPDHLIQPQQVVDHFRNHLGHRPFVDDLLMPSWEKRARQCFPCFPFYSMHPTFISNVQLTVHLTQTSFSDDDPIHVQMAQTLYRQLMGGAHRNCPRYGSHWEQIGFQGNDPATDLRGMGCLGLFHPLHMVMRVDLHRLAVAILALSRDEKQEFPFMVLSINITRIAYEALKKHVITKYVATCEPMEFFDRFNFFYVSILYQFFHVWKTGTKTIRDSGYVLQGKF
eukprot:maker-scaffold575_size133042-snap-gene-0.25 protein:Tk10147 transcript:maker-scaffold575_size133042-snap-gene-0.25-mRNA-1 annotation:"elmo domain-containing protein 3 isoform x2"